MSCLSRIGCVAVVALGGAGAWWLAGGELPFGASRRSDSTSAAASAGSRPLAWATVGGESASATSAAILSLSRREGPAFVNLGAADLAGLLGEGLLRSLPRSAASVQVAIADDLIHLRADVALRDLGGDALLGPLGRAIGDRDTLQMAGVLEVVRPGLGQFRVRELRVHDVGVPTRLIPLVVSALRSGLARTDSLADNGVPVPLPRTIADIRVAKSRVTLYKAIP